jgi:hypothetical protein
MRTCRANTLRHAAVIMAATLALIGATRSQAAAAPIGIVSFDELIAGPDGVNAFNVSNLTGEFALPLDFPVVETIGFIDATLTLTRTDGTNEIVALGDVAPGPLLDTFGFPLATLMFAGSQAFASATFQATVSQLTLLLADGTTLTADSSLLTASLVPLAGDTLSAGDFALIEVTPRVEPPPSEVPEASSLLLIATGLLLWRAAARSPHRLLSR